MPLQYFNISDSEVKFVNEEKSPIHRSENLEMDMATMVFESMQDKMKINQLENDLGNAVFEIMSLKTGGNY
jgi:hypothetical protein